MATKGMENLVRVLRNLRPIMAMVVVQVGFASLNIIFKIAIVDGIDLKIIVAYRFLFATIFALPLALVLEREKMPKLTWQVGLLSFASGLIGCTITSSLFLVTISLTSATFNTAGNGIVPGLTFIAAVLFRLEKLGLRSTAGVVKLAGTLIGVGGVFVFTLFKGSEVNIWSTHMNILSRHGGHVAHSGGHRPVVGAIVALVAFSSYSSWLLLQAKMSKYIEGQYWNNFLMNVMAAIQSIVFALCTERNWKKWRLGWNVGLLTVVYSGIVISGICYVIISWCLQLKGPVYVSAFSPLSVVVVAFVGSLIVDEQLYVGSVIGTILILGGLYMVLWGKNREMKEEVSSVLSMKDEELQRNTGNDGSLDRDCTSGRVATTE